MNEDFSTEIECPNCGERVYEEVTVCPKCGLHFFAEEEGEEPAKPGRGISLTAFSLGWLASAGLAFVLNMIAGVIWPEHLGSGFQILLLAAGPLGTLAGGFLAGLIAGRLGVQNGLIVGFAALIPAYFFEAYWHDLANQPIGTATLVSWAAMVGCGALGGWIWERMRMRA